MRRILALFTLVGPLLFALNLNAQTWTSATLSWNASPSQNIAGYRIYYGRSSGNYDTFVPVSNVTNVNVRGLTSGLTYYFAATAVDSSGNQSAFSPEISGVVGTTISAAAILTSALATKAGQFGFAISGQSGSQYAIQASTDLVNWVTLQTNVSPFNFVDSNASQFSRRFYRTVNVNN